MKNFLYRVKKEDSVFSLAKRFNACVGKIIADNNLVKEISAGDVLLITKEQNTYVIEPTDTIERVARKFCTTPERILTENKIPYIFCGLIIKV